MKRKAFVKIAGKVTGLWDCPGKGLPVWVQMETLPAEAEVS